MCRFSGLLAFVGWCVIAAAIFVALIPAPAVSLSSRSPQAHHTGKPALDILAARGFIPPTFSPTLIATDSLAPRLLGLGEEDRAESPPRTRPSMETAMMFPSLRR